MSEIKNLREASKHNWTSSNRIEDINAGSLQRIADAAEAMAKNYLRLQEDLDYLKGRVQVLRKRAERAERSNAALRGVITKMKNKRKSN